MEGGFFFKKGFLEGIGFLILGYLIEFIFEELKEEIGLILDLEI